MERGKKYYRHCIQSKLNSTEGGGCRMHGKDGQFVGSNEAEKEAIKCTSSIKVNGTGDKVQVNDAGKVSGVHHWKGKTTLITGDSMLSGLDERRLSNKCNVKVRVFPGCTIADLREHYIQPLLKKQPSSVIIHAGTNDATQEGATDAKILDPLLNLRAEVERNIEGCKVILSLPTQRVDKPSANKITQTLNKKIQSLGINVINNNNSRNDIGRSSMPRSQFGNYAKIVLKLFQIYQNYARFQIEVLLFGTEVRACAERFGQAHTRGHCAITRPSKPRPQPET